jgi:hypothetical protein
LDRDQSKSAISLSSPPERDRFEPPGVGQAAMQNTQSLCTVGKSSMSRAEDGDRYAVPEWLGLTGQQRFPMIDGFRSLVDSQTVNRSKALAWFQIDGIEYRLEQHYSFSTQTTTVIYK